MANTIIIQSKRGFAFDNIVIFGLVFIGWSLVILSVFDMLLRGVADMAGPGMGVFSHISPIALSDLFSLPYRFSLCVTDTGVWSIDDFAKSFLMWGAMILAMMVPTLISPSGRTPKTFRFTLGYLSVWFVGSLLAVLLQWSLSATDLLNANMVSQSSYLNALILMGVGAFQLSSLKQKQLARCQHWDTNFTGWQAGLNCMRCCGPLMLVMFAFGLMNVIVMALMTLFILVERYSKLSTTIVKASGLALIICSVISLV